MAQTGTPSLQASERCWKGQDSKTTPGSKNNGYRGLSFSSVPDTLGGSFLDLTATPERRK